MSTSNDVVRERSKFVTVTAAKTLISADSGDTFILNAAAGAAITLPALESGLKFKFIVGALFATTDWTIVCSVLVPAANETTISIELAADTIGDYLEIECDGTNYYINGVGAQAASITFA